MNFEVYFNLESNNTEVNNKVNELNETFNSYIEENIGAFKLIQLIISFSNINDTHYCKIDEFDLKNKLEWSDEDIECINKFIEENIDSDYMFDYFILNEFDNDSITISANINKKEY